MKTKTARIIENPIIDDRVTFVETSAETNGRYTSVCSLYGAIRTCPVCSGGSNHC